MSQTILYRIAAVALVVGAVLVTAGNLLAPQGDARAAVASGLYYPLALVVLLGGLLVMAGWTAVYLRQRAESGVLGSESPPSGPGSSRAHSASALSSSRRPASCSAS